MKLNPLQDKAASILSGPVLVLAGAGAGKTATLTARIIRLIESGVMPQNILAITFTNKAAGEMKERVLRAIADNSKLNFPVAEHGFTPTVCTFHALGVRILRDQHQHVGIKKHFAIYDRGDSRKAVKEAVTRAGLDPKQWDTKKVLSIISKNKGNFVSLSDFAEIAQESFYTETVYQIWKHYEDVKKGDSALDFDDLLLETAKLLEKNEAVRNHYRRLWTHVHIDEYQDTNKVQYTIAKLLITPETHNIFVVGDPDQLIYSWRGAEIKNIMSFEKDFPGAQTVILEQNYRSTKNIIEASNTVIEKNTERFPKKLFTEKHDGDKILLFNAYDALEEASWIAGQIKLALNNGATHNEIAVLYRANFQSRLLEEAMLKNNIPYQVLGTKFYDRAEVKDIMSYIKAALNPDSLVDVKRTINQPKRALGKTSIVKIFAGRESELTPRALKSLSQYREILDEINKKSDECSPSELVDFVIEVTGMGAMYKETGKEEDLERLANMYELAEIAARYDNMPGGEALERFLEDVALASDQDSKSDTADAVKLMTIHAAKGLEFDHVFISGCEESLFSPNEGDDLKNHKSKAEEERRLFYVAMTRAKESLYLSWASVRTVYGSQEVNMLCTFVLDIPNDMLEQEGGFSFGGERFIGEDEEEDIVYLDF